jgi:hypothetical protein
MRFLIEPPHSTILLISIVLPVLLAGCAQLSIRPQAVQPADPAVAADAIQAEPLRPDKLMVRDFNVSPASIRDNASPLHRLIEWLRQSPSEERRVKIGQSAAANVSEETVKRLNRLGLTASRVPSDSTAPVPDDVLLVTGRVLEANEGNRLTRVALGFGAGKSDLDTEVHVFRVVDGQRAEVLAFRTHADSGRMPGVVPSLGVGELFVGTITMLAKAKGVASSGEKIYSSQLDHLASRTGDEVARYLSQYAAKEGWIPRENAKSVRLAAD